MDGEGSYIVSLPAEAGSPRVVPSETFIHLGEGKSEGLTFYAENFLKQSSESVLPETYPGAVDFPSLIVWRQDRRSGGWKPANVLATALLVRAGKGYLRENTIYGNVFVAGYRTVSVRSEEMKNFHGRMLMPVVPPNGPDIFRISEFAEPCGLTEAETQKIISVIMVGVMGSTPN